ncbi:MAG: hypothetical protein D3M94_09235 [Rhodocyclales bacterium GT-UBC]|nr:MAG: hypothetical protein D3M94_09235 [Rhodocyclales bacterium GT-UBC]
MPISLSRHGLFSMKLAPTLARIRSNGSAPLLGLCLLLAVLLGAHAGGLLPPPKAGTTIYRLLAHPEIIWSLAVLIFCALLLLLFCRIEHTPRHALFLAGMLSGIGLTNALFFDPWLGVFLFGGAAPLFRRAWSNQAPPGQTPRRRASHDCR